METVRTLAIIKPDAVRAGNAGKVLSMIEGSGLAVEAVRMFRLTREAAGAFYAVHRGKSFYGELLEFMSSGPCIALVLSGENAVARWRELMGATNPSSAADGTIRKLYGTSVQFNACHGSDAPETARQEVAFFFSGAELPVN
ncbi:MAG: nucleoside-diphosphate kinase [Chitinispirillia bacterium]|nr:nucleoside-diphosphate kinase [Chitinispirillia bacterium]MCL2267759.1 nucleoside-diphosphate kinase [Chitinispirillia bacterium]